MARIWPHTRVGLPIARLWSEGLWRTALKKICARSSSEHPARGPRRSVEERHLGFDPELSDIRRNSRATIDAWREELSEEEVEVIRTITEPVSVTWYGESSWHA